MKISTLEASVSLDTSGFDRGVDSVQQQMITLKGEFETIDKSANKTSDVLTHAMGDIVADFAEEFIETFADIAWEVTSDGVMMASSLSEVQNVIDTTFGASAYRVESWARSAKKSFGMGELAAKEYASTLGAAFSTGDLDDNQIFELSTSLVQLAGDLSSFYNISQEDAFQKIFSGMTGEMEPLKSLGIVMSDASLKAHALENGFLEAGQKWENFKANADDMTLLRYSFLMEKTANAQGDFAKTSDSFANQLRLLDENINDLKISVGQSLLPVMTELVGWFNGLFGGAEEASEGIDALKESAKDTFWSIESTTSNALALVEALERLSASGEDAANADTWNAVLEQLQKTIPGIGDLIDAETGKIEGGTEALKEYIDSWRLFSLEQAKQKAMQGMYDEYAQIALEIVELQNDQYIADTLEANALSEQNQIVEELARQAYEYQKTRNPGSANQYSMDRWRQLVGMGLSGEGAITGWWQDQNTWGYVDPAVGYIPLATALMQGAGYTEEQLNSIRDEYQRWGTERERYASTDNAADIAEMQALLDSQATEIETLSALYTQALEQASAAEQTVIVQVAVDSEVVAEAVAPIINARQAQETQTKTKTR